MTQFRYRFNLSRWALQNQPMIRYLIAVLLLGGIFSYFQLGQDEDPPFTFRGMAIRAYLPGSTAVQVAEQLTDPIEKVLQDIPHMDKIQSYSKPGETQIIIMLGESTPASEIPGTWQKVRNKVNDIRGSLPTNTIGPIFLDEFGDTYGVIYALSADGFNYEQLKQYADNVRQELLRVPDVAKISFLGVQDEKIYIELSHWKLAQLGLSVNDIVNQINTQNTFNASGALTLPKESLWIRVSGPLESLEELRSLPLRANNQTIRLGDIAQIKRDYVDPPNNKMRVGMGNKPAQEVIGLAISMEKGGDIVRLGKSLEVAQAQIIKSLPIGIEMTKVADQPSAVSGSVNEFVRVLIEALVIVLAVSFVSLGLHTKPFRIDMRPGLVVAFTIPLVLAATFLLMKVLNINLHKISLGALIIALGLLVDDAIIAVEMMVRKMEEGHNRLDAAAFAYESTAFPMLTGTLITVAGFLPIAMAASSAGEYTFSIFAVTAIALVFSWVAAVIFTPYIGYLLLRIKAKPSEGEHGIFNTPFYQLLRRCVDWSVEYRKTVIIITLGMLVVGVLSFRFIEKQFFPDSTRMELMVDLWLPEGSSYAQTEFESKRLELWLAKQPEVNHFINYVGIGSPRFYLPLDQQFNQTNLAQFVVTARNLDDRNRLRQRLIKLFENDFPNVRGRVKLLANGPPVPYAVQFRVEGPDKTLVREFANKVRTVVEKNPSVVGVNDNWREMIKVVRLDIDQDKARAAGVSTEMIQRTTQTLLSGSPIGQYRESNKLIDIVLRQPEDERVAMNRLTEATIPTATGRYIPLSQVATISLQWEPGMVWRQNRDFAITIQSEVVDGIQGVTVAEQIDQHLGALRAELPSGYRIIVAGAAEESGKAQQSIMANLPFMLFVVMTLLMLQLRRFSMSMLVYLTGPLGIIGAALALLLTGQPFGFVAQLGVIALLGMIIRNAVILVDQIEQHLAAGEDTWTAIVESAVGRARPIMLTAAAAVLAMIPLSRSVFWGPMAVSIMGGLIVATLLTLLFLPALYALVFRVKRVAK